MVRSRPHTLTTVIRINMDVVTLIKRSEEIIQKIDATLHGAAISSDARHRLSGACLDVAIEHQKAIVVLINRKFYGSAFALVRAQFETYIRGLWLERCATDTEVDDFKRDKIDKSFKAIIENIENCEGYNVGVLSSVRVKSWDTMNSYTHGGYMQVVRRMSEDYMEPNYSEEEIIEVLNFANSIGMLAALEITIMTNKQDLVESIKGLIISNSKDL
jgi:hypothetical protein